MNKLAVLLLSSLLSLPAIAHEFTAGSLHIGHPWSRAMPEGSPTAAVFLSMDNHGKQADTLIGATTPQAGKVELHTHINDNGVMRMRELTQGISIAPDSSVKLAPGGLHLMLLQLKTQAKAGDSFPLQLQFEKAGKVNVEVRVESGLPAQPSH